MKLIITLCVLLLSSTLALAEDTDELILGSLTYHLIGGGSEEFSNKLSQDGRLIDNFLIGYQFTETHLNLYDSLAIFGGDNSVGKPIGGFKFSTGVTDKTWYLGPVIGGYVQNNIYFERVGLQPLDFGPANGVALVPIIGVELNYRINLNKKYFIKFNNILTPALTNLTLSAGVSF